MVIWHTNDQTHLVAKRPTSCTYMFQNLWVVVNCGVCSMHGILSVRTVWRHSCLGLIQRSSWDSHENDHIYRHFLAILLNRPTVCPEIESWLNSAYVDRVYTVMFWNLAKEIPSSWCKTDHKMHTKVYLLKCSSFLHIYHIWLQTYKLTYER